MLLKLNVKLNRFNLLPEVDYVDIMTLVSLMTSDLTDSGTYMTLRAFSFLSFFCFFLIFHFCHFVFYYYLLSYLFIFTPCNVYLRSVSNVWLFVCLVQICFVQFFWKEGEEEEVTRRARMRGAGSPNGRKDHVHVFGSALPPQCRRLLPEEVRPEAGRGAVRRDGAEGGAAGQAWHGVCGRHQRRRLRFVMLTACPG